VTTVVLRRFVLRDWRSSSCSASFPRPRRAATPANSDGKHRCGSLPSATVRHGVVTIHDNLGRPTRGFVGLMGSSFHRLGRVSDGGKVWRCRLGLPLLPRITSAAYHQGTGSRVSPLLRVVRACLPVSSRNRRMRPRVSTAFPSCASERIDGRAWPGPDGSCGCLDRGGRACRRNEGFSYFSSSYQRS